MPAAWKDPRVRAGMEAHLAEHRRRLDAGAQHLGWKIALAAPEARARTALEGPVVGSLTTATQHASPADISVADMQHPLAEPELAVWVGDFAHGGTDSFVAAVAPAIEIVDMHDEALSDVGRLLAAGV